MSLETRLRDRIKQITKRNHVTDQDETVALVLKEVANALELERLDAMKDFDRLAKG